ncbi:hypothetical protein [Neobacillus drentensis]|uniref:hypothetical protein n=1 Tax=Neobacillus drentensis TaxID=220684 RepID=UPI002FFD9ED1
MKLNPVSNLVTADRELANSGDYWEGSRLFGVAVIVAVFALITVRAYMPSIDMGDCILDYGVTPRFRPEG